ncbi:unnamed protein product [Phytophthora fragariaefolia]|uniref:Unnamed protein product n=1 Tax=Phytophthora fragariaefolia TaxID=1490495 RepID=A0A9W7CXA3_9STRA|nr:unnamed protein product [Phytophthora fragariaefolia]
MRTLRERRDHQQERVKCITTDDAVAFRTRVINGMLDVPFCPDTGSDANIIGRPALEELRGLVHDLRVERVELTVQVVVAGGNVVLCRPAFGNTTLQSIGVDLDGVFEQLAQQHIDAAEAEADDVPNSHVEVLGAAGDIEAETVMHRLVDEAIEAGFDADRCGELRRMVIDYADVFRLRLGHDEPADVEPLEVRVEAGAQPYRRGVQRYPEAQRQFRRDYVRELESAGLVVRNNHSRWSCPALPVAKRGSGEFRITIDYRPVDRMTVPLAGAAPNLAVAVEPVRGAYGFGVFDFHKVFWQMLLHPNSQEMFSFVTENGVFTPTRVPQGASDSAVLF